MVPSGAPSKEPASGRGARSAVLLVLLSAPFWWAALLFRPLQEAFGSHGDYHPVLASPMVLGIFLVTFTGVVAFWLHASRHGGRNPWVWSVAATAVWCGGAFVFLVVSGISAVNGRHANSRTYPDSLGFVDIRLLSGALQLVRTPCRRPREESRRKRVPCGSGGCRRADDLGMSVSDPECLDPLRRGLSRGRGCAPRRTHRTLCYTRSTLLWTARMGEPIGRSTTAGACV